MDLARKFRTWTVNLILITGALCLVMLFLILCNKYETTHNNAKLAEYDMEAARYRAQTESVKMQTAQIHLDAENARLKAFIKAFSKGEYPNGEIEK